NAASGAKAMVCAIADAATTGATAIFAGHGRASIADLKPAADATAASDVTSPTFALARMACFAAACAASVDRAAAFAPTCRRWTSAQCSAHFIPILANVEARSRTMLFHV